MNGPTIRAGRYGSEPQQKTSLRVLTIYWSISSGDACITAILADPLR